MRGRVDSRTKGVLATWLMAALVAVSFAFAGFAGGADMTYDRGDMTAQPHHMADAPDCVECDASSGACLQICALSHAVAPVALFVDLPVTSTVMRVGMVRLARPSSDPEVQSPPPRPA